MDDTDKVAANFPCCGTPSHVLCILSPVCQLTLQYASTLLIHVIGGFPLASSPSIMLSFTLNKTLIQSLHHVQTISENYALPILYSTFHFINNFSHNITLKHIFLTFSIPMWPFMNLEEA